LSLSESQACPYTSRSDFAAFGETDVPATAIFWYLIDGALIVAVGVVGYNLYQTRKEPEGLQINLGPNGLKVQNK
jgi:hypothetical protein